MESNGLYKKSSFQVLNFQELSDCTLRTEDGGLFKIHRIILAKSSKYFFALFCGIGKGKKDVLIRGIRQIVLSNILQYIYTSKVNLTEENVYELLMAADYFLLDDLLVYIKVHLNGILSVRNCMPLFIAAVHINRKDILIESYRFVQTHFETVVQTEDLYLSNLPLESMVQFLGDRNLCVGSEKSVWLAIVKWIQGDILSRLAYLPDLLTYLKIWDMDEELAMTIHHDMLVNSSFREVINQLHYSDILDNYLKIIFDYIKNNPEPVLSTYDCRLPTTLHFISHYSITNRFDGTKIFVTYDENIDVWREIAETNICARPETILVIGRDIYLSQQNENRIFRFNMDDKEWHQIINFNVLYSYQILELEGLIYLLGMSNACADHEKYIMVVYNPKKHFWTKISPIKPAKAFQSVSFEKRMYVVGNISASVGSGMIAQIYEPKFDNWSLIPPPTIFRFDFAIVVYCKKLYLIGGTNGKEYLKSVEVFDPKYDEWSVLTDLPYVYYKPKGLVLNDQLIIYDNYLPNRSYLKANPSVLWDDTHRCWEPYGKNSAMYNLCKFCFSTVDDLHCINMVTKESRNPKTNFVKTPFCEDII